MTLDTIFDIASLTKVVATTPAVMMLVEEGRIRLTDPVATFIPEFAKYGKDRVTVRDLLTHMSGLRPDLDLARSVGGPRRGHSPGDRGSADRSAGPPLRLQRHQLLPARRNRQPRQQAAARGLRARAVVRAARHARHDVPAAGDLVPRIAPTEACTPYGYPCEGPDRTMLRGVVHDPTARRMGGVAGHAGVFSHGRRSDAVRAHAARRRRARRGARAVAADGGAHDVAGDTGRRAERARTRLGHRLVVFGQSRRAPAARLVRPHGIHRHVALDRSGDARVRHLSVESRASGRQGRRDAAARARRDDCGVGADRRAGQRAARRGRSRASRFDAQIPAVPGAGAARRCWPASTCCAPTDSRRSPDFASACSPITPAARATARATIDLIAAAPGVKLVSLFSPEHGIRGILDASVPVDDRRAHRPADPLAVRRHAAARRPRCSPASTRSSSTCRTSARASTPT